ncbi:MAG: hypothetical protein KAI79_10155 [Bacteroidales bacterium]|nr:hypothetical protein [Bacteroidales bacterium]
MYKCIKNVNTDLGAFKVGDVVGEGIGSKYSQFEKVEEVKVPKKKKEKNKKKEQLEQKEELLVETPSKVEVEVTETPEEEQKETKKNWFS